MHLVFNLHFSKCFINEIKWTSVDIYDKGPFLNLYCAVPSLSTKILISLVFVFHGKKTVSSLGKLEQTCQEFKTIIPSSLLPAVALVSNELVGRFAGALVTSFQWRMGITRAKQCELAFFGLNWTGELNKLVNGSFTTQVSNKSRNWTFSAV